MHAPLLYDYYYYYCYLSTLLYTLLSLDTHAPAPSDAVPQWCWLASMHHQLPRALKTWCMSLKLAHALSAFTVLEAL